MKNVQCCFFSRWSPQYAFFRQKSPLLAQCVIEKSIISTRCDLKLENPRLIKTTFSLSVEICLKSLNKLSVGGWKGNEHPGMREGA